MPLTNPPAGASSGSVAITDGVTQATVDPDTKALTVGQGALDPTLDQVALGPRTSGGTTTNKRISGASTNAVSIKASAGQVYGWFITNSNAAARYVKLFNKATVPIPGTDVPVLTLMVPANSYITASFPLGIPFSAGIGLAMTAGNGDLDTTAIGAGDIISHIFWK